MDIADATTAIAGALLVTLLIAKFVFGRRADPSLFVDQPPRPECPVCMVTLPLEVPLTTDMQCCGKSVCGSCAHETFRSFCEVNVGKLEKKQPFLDLTCPFCRTDAPYTDEDALKLVEERVAKGDANAIYHLAGCYSQGQCGVEVDMGMAIELLHRAADKGNTHAALSIGGMHCLGLHGLAVNMKRGLYYLELSAKGGDPFARYDLGCIEYAGGNKDIAARHWRMAAAAGHKESVDELIKCFREGIIDKTSLEKSLRAKQKACDEMWSEERERYGKWIESLGDCPDASTFKDARMRDIFRDEKMRAIFSQIL